VKTSDSDFTSSNQLKIFFHWNILCKIWQALHTQTAQDSLHLITKTLEALSKIHTVVQLILLNLVHPILAGFFDFSLFLLPGLRLSFSIIVFLAKHTVAGCHSI
jgi:hypothetical protein